LLALAAHLEFAKNELTPLRNVIGKSDNGEFNPWCSLEAPSVHELGCEGHGRAPVCSAASD
jgi:hypothetical protein